MVGGESDLLDRARCEIARLERCWTRFSDNSDVSRINRSAGQPIEVDPSTIRLVTAMVSGWVLTLGAFDPSQLAPLVELGYATSWCDSTATTSLTEHPMLRAPLDHVCVDPVRSIVQAPAGIGLDAGGIGKGLAADMVVESLIAAGADGALVSIGGDVRVSGTAPHAGGWTVAVAGIDEHHPTVLAHLHDGAVATSGTQRRVWTDQAGLPQHHLLDPATARPITTSRPGTSQPGVALVEATVIAGTGAWAEVWTKALLVRGPATVMPELTDRGLAGRIVYADGFTECNDMWAAFAPTAVAA